MSQDEDLVALEALMKEFYSHTTSNHRKREIEGILDHFVQQKQAWKSCLHFMVRTSSHYVCMFSLNSLETIIHKQWIGLPGEERTEIRNTLNGFLVEHYKSAPVFIRNKMVKLVIDVARTDWPHFYPDFFPTILQFIRTEETMLLGLNMLLIASEELATPREDLPTSRKEELKKLLLNYMPETLTVLTDILSKVLEKRKQRSESSPSIQSFKVDERSRSSQSPEDSLWDEIGIRCLECVVHIFTWLPLSRSISQNLINVVLQFAALGGTTPAPNPIEDTSTSMAVLAMSAVNEIVSKNCVPLEFEAFLLQLFNTFFQLLQVLIHDSIGNTVTVKHFDTLDEMYVDKVAEFLLAFVSGHLRRFERNPQFPTTDFLSAMFQFTFLHSRLETYFACLDIWTVCIDYVLVTKKEQVQSKFDEALEALVFEVVAKTQFRHNEAMLETINDDSVDDDERTEWQQYLFLSNEVVMKVAELKPATALKAIILPWKEARQIFFMLDKHIIEGNRLNISQASELRQLRNTLKDFATLLQMVGRLSSLFIGESFLSRMQEGHELVKQLIEVASFCLRHKIYHLSVQSEHVQSELVNIHAQTLAALKAWCHWLFCLHTTSLKNPALENQCRDLINNLMMAVALAVKDPHCPPILAHSAVHFMVTLTGTVRPPSIWKVKDFTDLYNSIQTLNLNDEDKRLLVRALANVLLLHWPGLEEQRWEERQKHLTKFLRDITVSFRQLKTLDHFATNRQLQVDAQQVVQTTLRVIGDLIENILNESTHTKKLCFECVKEFIDEALWLFPIYVADSSTCEELFKFFHTVFDVLKAQMGAEAVEKAIQIFLTVFNKDQLTEVILHEGTTGIRVVERFLQILEFVVKEPSSTFRQFIPSTIALCMDHIYPLVADKPTADIKSAMYSVLFNILLHNQRYFFKPSVARLLSSSSLNTPSKHEEVLNKEQLLAIMQAFGQSFLMPDISVFKQNVNALETLNEKWKLYDKEIFKTLLTEHFLTAFVHVLIQRSHDLLKEEILACIYHMASVDIEAFFDQFISRFLDNAEGIDANQRSILKSSFKPVSDYPSFLINMDRFVNDIRYYRLCNASLPTGSVKLT